MTNLDEDLEVLRVAIARAAGQGHRFAEAYLKQFERNLIAERYSSGDLTSNRLARADPVTTRQANPFMYPLK
jgi:hypothetical protein